MDLLQNVLFLIVTVFEILLILGELKWQGIMIVNVVEWIYI